MRLIARKYGIKLFIIAFIYIPVIHNSDDRSISILSV